MSLPIRSDSVGRLEIKAYAETNQADGTWDAGHPHVQIRDQSWNEPFRVLGGGAFSRWGGPGVLLTAMYPNFEKTSDTEILHEDPDEGTSWMDEASDGLGWHAASKEHNYPESADLTAYCFAARIDPFFVEVPGGDPVPSIVYVRETSSENSRPHSVARLPEGYVLTGGGARAEHAPEWGGLLLTESAPGARGERPSWSARAKDQGIPSPGTVTAWAIGLHERFLELMGVKVHRFHAISAPGPFPVAAVEFPEEETGLVLIGGGARTVPPTPTPGILLTASFPGEQFSPLSVQDDQPPRSWQARAKEHGDSVPDAMVETWAFALGPV